MRINHGHLKNAHLSARAYRLLCTLKATLLRRTARRRGINIFALSEITSVAQTRK